MTRTPRQRQGERLVPVITHVPPEVRASLARIAEVERRSVSQVVRRVLEDFLARSERVGEASPD